MSKILAFAGSTRKDSFNKKLVKQAAAGALEAGADVTIIDLKDFPMPLYDEDLETAEGVPVMAQKFKQLLKENDAFLIASPEYNGHFSAVLKNAIDWASRQEQGESVYECFRGKVVTIMSTSPGAMGGIRGLAQIRNLLSILGCIVLPGQLAVGNATEVFDEAGNVINEKRLKSIKKLGSTLVQMSDRLID